MREEDINVQRGATADHGLLSRGPRPSHHFVGGHGPTRRQELETEMAYATHYR